MLWWRETLKTGHENIDSQHKKIFDLAEEVMDLNESSSRQQVMEAFQELVRYTNQHFKDEEALMIEKRYKELSSHVKLHQHFIDVLNKLMIKIHSQGVNESNIDELKLLMVDWLMNHIDLVDRKFIESIK